MVDREVLFRMKNSPKNSDINSANCLAYVLSHLDSDVRDLLNEETGKSVLGLFRDPNSRYIPETRIHTLVTY